MAVDQYGYVTSKDARRLGVNPVELGKLAAPNQLEHVSYGVYRFPQLPVNPLDPYMLATLWTNGRGVLSHDTALDLHEVCDINPPPKKAPPHRSRATTGTPSRRVVCRALRAAGRR